MKDSKKQKTKTYNRRKKETIKKQNKNINLWDQIHAIDSEINDFKLTLTNKKIDLFFKVGGGATLGVLGGIFPLVFFSPESENINQLFSDFIQKVDEQPFIAATPIIGVAAGYALLEFVLYLNDAASFHEIKEVFKYNKELLNKKEELESIIKRKNYKDADREKSNQKTKKRKK